MQIKKAVITAAARGGRLYPVGDTVQKAMLPIADLDGIHKPVLQIIAEEAFESGIEEICIICAPGDEARYQTAFQTLRSNLLEAFGKVEWAQKQADKISYLLKHLTFVVQEETLGYGHAVYCAKDFVGDDPFILMLGDHLYLADHQQLRCAQQLIDLAENEGCAVSAVNATPEHLIHQYGTINGRYVAGQRGVYEIERIIEKPSLSQAELELSMPGQRVGHYLCFFGMHILTADIFGIMEEHMSRLIKGQDIQLTPALELLGKMGKYLALEVKGRRYNLGTDLGWLEAQISFGLEGVNSNALLSSMVQQLAEARIRNT
ncbi:MAG: sugar phosphate nucleotidyltransferase [Bacteroidota bacterium]